MSVKYERPSERRMMMHFNKEFIDMLPIFKQGLEGNERDILQAAATEMAKPLSRQPELKILDVGSGDGDWIRKLARTFKDQLDLHRAAFTTLEPVENNPGLRDVCRQEKFTSVFQRIEECDLKPATYDIVTSWHTAYYYYNQPLAHEMLFRLLKPGGWMIVTLVSQFCVLNALTEELLGPHRQFALNAESYISLVSKLGIFSLRKVVPHEGGLLDVGFYTSSSEHVRALEYVLARHRLPVDDVEREVESFAGALQKHSTKERLNLIMFFQKPHWTRTGTSITYSVLPPGLDSELESLRKEFVELAGRRPPNERGIIEMDLEAFTREIRSGWHRSEVLDVLRRRLEDDAERAEGEVNRLLEKIDDLIQKLASARSP